MKIQKFFVATLALGILVLAGILWTGRANAQTASSHPTIFKKRQPGNFKTLPLLPGSVFLSIISG